MSFSATDHALMARALRLAERGAFTTRPNPMVGCVIAHGESVVGEGWHQRKGGPHAEGFALQAAGERAKGATAYVTLEPCAHTGSTGPCADALIAAGVARVVGAMRDPFPQVDGTGFEKLRAAGIEVESGLMEAQARELNRGFLSRIERGRPWLRIKLAMSLDGRTAMASGDSKWISGEAARRDVHQWRARSGALLTGAGTVLASVFGNRLSRRIGPGPSMPVAIGVCSVGWMLLAVAPVNAWGVAAFAFMLFAFGVGAVLIFINFLAMRQAVTPEPLLGRMTSTMRWLILIPAGPGALIGGWLGEHAGLRASLAFAGGSALLLALLAWRTAVIREVRELPQPEHPDDWLGAEGAVRLPPSTQPSRLTPETDDGPLADRRAEPPRDRTPDPALPAAG